MNMVSDPRVADAAALSLVTGQSGRARLGSVQPGVGNLGGILPSVVEVIAVIPESGLVNSALDRDLTRPRGPAT